MTSGLGTSAHAAAEQMTVSWLDGTKVLTVGSSPSLDVAGNVLRQLGADVVTGDVADGQTSPHIVLVDRIAGPAGVPGRDASASEYVQYVAAENRAIWVTA